MHSRSVPDLIGFTWPTPMRISSPLVTGALAMNSILLVLLLQTSIKAKSWSWEIHSVPQISWLRGTQLGSLKYIYLHRTTLDSTY